MKIGSIVIAFVLCLSSFSFAEGKVTDPKSTSVLLESMDIAPEFSLGASDGKTYSLKDLKGKIVVLEWFNNDCPFVEKHYGTGNMQKLQEKYTKEGVIWFSISSTKPEHALDVLNAQKILQQRKVKHTALLLDSDGAIARAYGAKTTPHMFVISGEGKIVYNGAIDDNSSFRKDTVSKARNYVSETLDILLGKSSKKEIDVSVTKPYGCSVKI